MRGFVTALFALILIAFAFILVVFAVQNPAIRAFGLFGLTFSAPVWIVTVAAALAGFLLGLLLVTPARAGMDAALGREHRRVRDLERELAVARRSNASLRERADTLQSTTPTTPATAPTRVTSSAPVTPTAPADNRIVSEQPTVERTAPGRVVDQPVAARATTPVAEPNAERETSVQPSLTNRLRSLLNRDPSDREAQRGETPNSPNALV